MYIKLHPTKDEKLNTIHPHRFEFRDTQTTKKSAIKTSKIWSHARFKRSKNSRRQRTKKLKTNPRIVLTLDTQHKTTLDILNIRFEPAFYHYSSVMCRRLGCSIVLWDLICLQRPWNCSVGWVSAEGAAHARMAAAATNWSWGRDEQRSVDSVVGRTGPWSREVGMHDLVRLGTTEQ
ncbi:hypothetical protein J6590_032797 [Homalodisca vitripennis]|nr:hypothetical protein J6590_032797 [Homalodisca vitripennis]